MNVRRGLLVLALVVVWSALTLTPVSAKDVPAFFTIEGGDITTPIPFRSGDIDDHISMVGALFADKNRLTPTDEEIEAYGDSYIIRGYTQVAGGVGGAEIRFIQSSMTPLRYYPGAGEDGQGIIQYIGPATTTKEQDQVYYLLTEEIDAVFRENLELAEWYQMLPTLG